METRTSLLKGHQSSTNLRKEILSAGGEWRLHKQSHSREGIRFCSPHRTGIIAAAKHLCSFTGQDDQSCPEKTSQTLCSLVLSLSRSPHVQTQGLNETAHLSARSATSAVPTPVFVIARTNLSSGSQEAWRQPGRCVEGGGGGEGDWCRRRTERSRQPYIWIRSTSWALMASHWNLKHGHGPERSSWGKSEYQQPFRSACTRLPCYSSIFPPPELHSRRQKAFTEGISTLVLCVEWQTLLRSLCSTVGFLLTAVFASIQKTNQSGDLCSY